MTRRTVSKWVVDSCPDANGYWTIRIDDGTENGSIDDEPIATVYCAYVAVEIVDSHNEKLERI